LAAVALPQREAREAQAAGLAAAPAAKAPALGAVGAVGRPSCSPCAQGPRSPLTPACSLRLVCHSLQLRAAAAAGQQTSAAQTAVLGAQCAPLAARARAL
jgi:hypothetical protein